MKVKANWPVDTGDKVHQTGDKFDLPDDQAEQLERLGAVEILSRKRAAKESESESGDGGDGGAGGEPQS